MRLLRLRVAAALIDIALMIVLLIVLGLATGNTSATARPDSISGRVSVGVPFLTYGPVTLRGYWVAVYIVLLLAYFFVFEVTIAATVGKLLTGLRVEGADGTKPSAWAIAVRTLLRLIDWLPVLYLVGFIAVLATRERRMRLGDLAAGTRVVRLQPVPDRLAVVPVTLLAVLTILGLTLRMGSVGEPGFYHAHNVSFSYPADWQQTQLHVTASTGSQERLWRTAVALTRPTLSSLRHTE